jgi:hypothetical protein
MDSAAKIPWPGSRHLQRAAEPADDEIEIHVEEHPSSALTRTLASLVLLGLAAGLAFLGHTAYRAMTDSYVAPMSLSPDSDPVVASKAKLTQLEIERARVRTQAEAIDAELAGIDVERTRLAALLERTTRALPWTQNINSLEAKAGTAAASSLAQERSVLLGMIARQEKIVDEARANMELGIIPRADYEKEEQSLSQVSLALLENDRSHAQSELSHKKTILGQRSLAGRTGAPAMPELLANEGLIVRLELELLRVDSQKRVKLGEKRALAETLGQLDELAALLKSRPLFQAIEKNLDLAFVPYTQLEGVAAGAKVFSCVWGFFACQEIGSVAEVVPGEVVLPDPWGKQARGQYAVLNLHDREAARATTLRVRSSGPLAPPAPVGGEPSRAETSSR